MKKILSLVLIVVFVLSAVSCGGDDLKYSAYDPYDPYYNIYKEDVPTKKTYSVKGKTFYFGNTEDDLMIRDKDGLKYVEAEASLMSLYIDVKVVFIDENTVEFNDASKSTLSIPATKGVREKNVLTIKYTNEAGRTTDIRIEIHKEKIVVIHDVHTYSTPGMYTTIIFHE